MFIELTITNLGLSITFLGIYITFLGLTITNLGKKRRKETSGFFEIYI